jgi:hypothetical protein
VPAEITVRIAPARKFTSQLHPGSFLWIVFFKSAGEDSQDLAVAGLQNESNSTELQHEKTGLVGFRNATLLPLFSRLLSGDFSE